MDKTPIYKESYLYAYEHGEDAQYIASRTANIKCKAEIERAIAVVMANLQREVQLKFRVTPEERALIEQKMAQLGTVNMAAYLRKMAIDGFVVNLELPELGELRQSHDRLWDAAQKILTYLAKIQ